MQKKINQILEGNFDYEKCSLDFSCAKIEFTIHQGEVLEGSFHIYAPQGRFCSGNIMSTDLRMECITREFIGCEEEILYCFHGENLEEGDVVKGNFCVISNQGEYYLPFVVSVEYSTLESSIGPIRNLFHFANLAKCNWKEALALYYSKDFKRVFEGTDVQFMNDYCALSAHNGSEQNMEEFLIQINKKQKMNYLVQEEQLSFDLTDYHVDGEIVEKELNIIKNGWGYTNLCVACSGDFLFTEKEVLTAHDFSGTKGVLTVYVDTGYCHRGRNFGEVILSNSYVSLRVPVVVKIGNGRNKAVQQLAKKRILVQVLEYYESFKLKKISSATWMKETGKLIEKLISMDENDMTARLFQAQILITEARNNEAVWILDHVAEQLEQRDYDETVQAYYLYLTTLLNKEAEYITQVTKEVEHLYRKDNSNWRVAWLLLYLSEEYHKSAAAKWLFLEKQFYAGCSSPIQYLEAVALLNNNAALLRRLGMFELQILMYSVKKNLYNAEILEQILTLADKNRDFNRVLFQILVKYYENHEDDRILQQICAQLIKGGKTGRKYFAWYAKGVAQKLRITNLYEYYMLSVDLDILIEIPKEVMMYFSYQSNLDYERAAYLYHCLLQNEKYQDLYETYMPRIERFCMEQIEKLRINRHLAFLYGKILVPDIVNQENCGNLSKLLYAHSLRVEHPEVKKVYVYHKGIKYPSEYLLSDGEAWISLYGNDYTIAFEDQLGNRVVKSVEYTLEKLMIPGKLVRSLTKFYTGNLDFELHISGAEIESGIQDEEGANRAERIVGSDVICESIQKQLLMNLISYYYEKDQPDRVDRCLECIAEYPLCNEERNDVVRFLISRDKYELARQWLYQYGPYFLEVKLLVRLLTRLIEQQEKEEDPLLVASAYYAFTKGKYNSVLLDYLKDYYEGLTKTLRDIWKAAQAYQLDCYGLDESILIQMLYSGAFVGEKVSIFLDYVSKGPNSEIEDAFLIQCCYEYYARDKLTDKAIFDEIQRIYYLGESIPDVCRLGYIKYYSENPDEMNEDVKEFVRFILSDFMNRGIYLECFREFKFYYRVCSEMSDKTIIEYHTDSAQKACIHYVILHENGDSDEYVSEYMKEIFRGICYKEIVLFFGEVLQYYITEEIDGVEQLTESKVVQKSDIGTGEIIGSYQLINDIEISRTLEDFDTMEKLLEEYSMKEYLGSRLFEIM